MVTWGSKRERAVLAGRSALFAKGQIWPGVAGYAGFLKGCYAAKAVLRILYVKGYNRPKAAGRSLQ